MSEFLSTVVHWGLVVTSVFVIVDPLGAVPIFLALTEGRTENERRFIAKRASITFCCVLLVFATAGGAIMRIFGFTIDAFRIAGGILLMRVALDMLRAQRPKEKGTHTELEESAEDIAIVPLAVPMLSGPVAITTVMVHASHVQTWYLDFPILFSCIGLVALATYLILANAGRIFERLGPTVLKTMLRLMGLLLVVMAVQFVLDGITGYAKTLAGELAALDLCSLMK